jgi:hypothetical protein
MRKIFFFCQFLIFFINFASNLLFFKNRISILENPYIYFILKSKTDKYYLILENGVGNCNLSEAQVKYLTLGNITVKIENYIQEFSTHIETHFGFCLSDQADVFDKVFCILWEEKKNPDKSLKDSFSEEDLLVTNPTAKTHYLFCDEFSIDVVRKMGHLFVKWINEIAKTPNQAMVHAAAVGIDNNGVLICARGGGGKSTLAVSAMLDGFQYVSDDYLVLSRDAECHVSALYAHPIYSTINLSSKMYEKLSTLKAKYMYDNYYNPKYTLDISAHHECFVKKLPVNRVIFPRIADVETPSIEPMHKGKAIVQLIHSTISQMGDYKNTDYVKMITSFLSGLDFYQINLSPDLDANVKILKQFIKE